LIVGPQVWVLCSLVHKVQKKAPPGKEGPQ
jgi:hypothetical protein